VPAKVVYTSIERKFKFDVEVPDDSCGQCTAPAARVRKSSAELIIIGLAYDIRDNQAKFAEGVRGVVGNPP